MIRTTFSIKDLENLSGIKAHTIRIWEKRYDLLTPMRSDTNIRYYDLQSLQKILNVSYLKSTGSKISAIAALSDKEIEQEVRKLAQKTHQSNHLLQELKLAMVNFDQELFNSIYDREMEKGDFSTVFHNLLIPFLEELGRLWHSNTINIAHEHFISSLIKQKLLVEIEHAALPFEKKNEEPFILFLPENEMHDIGLLFLNYKLLKSGYNTIYLGASMLLDSLTFFQRNGQRPIFMTFITVEPTPKKIPRFLEQFNKKMDHAHLILMGRAMSQVSHKHLSANHHVINSYDQIEKFIQQQLEEPAMV